jgi:hypothetical protein
VLTIVPSAVGVVTIVKVALPPPASVGTKQVTVPLELEQPLDADTKLRLAGSGSVTRTLAAVAGPTFRTTSV